MTRRGPAPNSNRERTTCRRCDAPVTFDRSGEETIVRDYATGQGHTCSTWQNSKAPPAPPPAPPPRPTSIHRDTKPEKGAAGEKLLTFVGDDRLIVRPRGGGSLEIRRTEAGFTVVGKSPGGTGIPMAEDELDLFLAAILLRKIGIDLRQLWESCSEVSA